MFRYAYEAWVESGGVFGRWRATPVPNQQIAASEKKLQSNLQQALGPERYLDYQMAISSTGQQLRNFAARYGVPRETVATVFGLLREAEQIQASLKQSRQSNPEEAAAQLIRLDQKAEEILGSEPWQVWNQGKNVRPALDP